MTTLYLLFNHQLTDEQQFDAKKTLGVAEFVTLSDDLQKLWSNIPPDLETLDDYLKPIIDHLGEQQLKDTDIALVQGDFGATFKVVNFLKLRNIKVFYATTRREVIEQKQGDKMIKESIFKHIRYREY